MHLSSGRRANRQELATGGGDPHRIDAGIAADSSALQAAILNEAFDQLRRARTVDPSRVHDVGLAETVVGGDRFKYGKLARREIRIRQMTHEKAIGALAG